MNSFHVKRFFSPTPASISVISIIEGFFILFFTYITYVIISYGANTIYHRINNHWLKVIFSIDQCHIGILSPYAD